MEVQDSKGYKIVSNWLEAKGFKPFLFQQQAWQHIVNSDSGLVNAPTGCGKTYSVFLGSLIAFINQHPDNYKAQKNNGLAIIMAHSSPGIS